MNQLSTILSILGLAAAAGFVAAYFRASGGKANRELLESNIAAYKDAEAQKDKQIAALKIQIQTKDDIIERLVHDRPRSQKKR